MEDTVRSNIRCLMRILEFNAINGLLFFRIGSGLIPFASHPVCDFNWESRFAGDLERCGGYIGKHAMRISMHPDQFIVINSTNRGVSEKSVLELEYHCRLLDIMGLGSDAKIQIHCGGVYGDKKGSMERFIKVYESLNERLRSRLVIENDDKSYSVRDCLEIHKRTGIPVLFDFFHHEINPGGLTLSDALNNASSTWSQVDGVLMCDYSSQEKGARRGVHASSLVEEDLRKKIKESGSLNYDLMLEIKDKEESAIKALRLINGMKKPGAVNIS